MLQCVLAACSISARSFSHHCFSYRQLGPVSQYMINEYCDNLKDTFAQAVQYGILAQEDAQCFSVQASIESGFFILAGGAVILALVNTFVTKAVFQYFRDSDLVQSKRMTADGNVSDSGLTNADSDEGDEAAVADAGFTARIQPVPVLFTDTFRWLLRADISLPSSNRALFGSPGNELWDLPEAKAVSFDGYNDAIIEGEYFSDDDTVEKKANIYSRKSISTKHRYPPAATAQRRLTFDDETSGSGTSGTDSRQSFSGPIAKGNLKDDSSATYATPPGAQSRVRSQHSIRSSLPNKASTRSLDPSVDYDRSVDSTIGSRPFPQPATTPTEQAPRFLERNADHRSLQSSVRTPSNSARESRSEYVEETVDGDEMFEEFSLYEDETISHYEDD